jgi:hypothetical protein
MTDPLRDLRRELVSAAWRESNRVRGAGGHAKRTGSLAHLRRRGRVGLALVVVLVLASATAVGADQLFGPPVRTRVLPPAGRPASGSVVFAPLRVADPAGGFPWGLRFYLPRQANGGGSASNAVRCLQYGRVAGNTLGVLGEDGAFGDDGQFHALPVERLAGCIGSVSVAVSEVLVPASAFSGPGSCIPPPPLAPGPTRRASDVTRALGKAACAPAALRLVVYGVAAPGTLTVRLRGTRRTMTEHLVRSDHAAFMFVLPASADTSGRLRLEFGR